jgi:hypothetical protein
MARIRVKEGTSLPDRHPARGDRRHRLSRYRSRGVAAVARALRIGACASVLAAALAGCGDDGSSETAAPLPHSGRTYRALGAAQRVAVATTCRDHAVVRARGAAARQLHDIDPRTLRDEIDDAYRAIAEQHRPVADVCSEVIPFVTPGLHVSFDGAKAAGDGTFTVETTSDKPLTIRGRVTPAPASGRVVARRDLGPPTSRSTTIAPDGRFAFAALRLRKVADNTFTLILQAPPNAPRKVLFSAICLDCLAGAPPPNAQQ